MDDLRTSNNIYEILGAIAGYIWFFSMYHWSGAIVMSLFLLALLIAG